MGRAQNPLRYLSKCRIFLSTGMKVPQAHQIDIKLKNLSILMSEQVCSNSTRTKSSIIMDQVEELRIIKIYKHRYREYQKLRKRKKCLQSSNLSM